MTNIQGYDGDFDLPGTALHAGNMKVWNASLRYPLSNVTGFSDTRLQRNRRGMAALEGSAVGNAVKDVAVVSGGSAPTHGNTGGTGIPGDGSGAGGAAMTLTIASGCTWGFTGVISGISFAVDKLGESVLTFDFAGGDASDFVETWDITA